MRSAELSDYAQVHRCRAQKAQQAILYIERNPETVKSITSFPHVGRRRYKLTGVAGRLERALHNFVETFPLFAAAVLTAHVAARHSWMTEWGAQLYFWARVVYLALYGAGIFLLRSLVWNVATLGIVLILLSLV